MVEIREYLFMCFCVLFLCTKREKVWVAKLNYNILFTFLYLFSRKDFIVVHVEQIHKEDPYSKDPIRKCCS